MQFQPSDARQTSDCIVSTETGRKSVADLGAELQAFKVDAGNVKDLKDAFQLALNIADVLEIANSLSDHILEPDPTSRSRFRFLDYFIVESDRSKPISEYRRFRDECGKYIEPFDKIANSKSHARTEQNQSLKIEGVEFSDAELPKEELGSGERIRTFYSILYLFDQTMNLIEALSDVSKFIGTFKDDDRRLGFFRTRSANQYFEKALDTADSYAEACSSCLVLLQLTLPSMVAGIREKDRTSKDEEQKVFEPDPEELVKLRSLKDSELISKIRETASRLEPIDDVLGEECSLLLLSEDLDLVRFREPVAALRYAANEIRVSALSLESFDTITTEKPDFFFLFRELIKAQRYALLVNLLSYALSDVLENTYRDLESRKNLLQVTNPAREEVQRSLDAFHSGLTSLDEPYRELHTLVLVYRERAELYGMIRGLTSALSY